MRSPPVFTFSYFSRDTDEEEGNDCERNDLGQKRSSSLRKHCHHPSKTVVRVEKEYLEEVPGEATWVCRLGGRLRSRLTKSTWERNLGEATWVDGWGED